MRNDEWKYPEFEPIRLSDQEEINLIINPKDYYSSKYLIIEQSETYKFTVGPTERWKDWFRTVTVEGFDNLLVRDSKLRMPEYPCFRLCGTLEANESDHFSIGSELKRQFDRAGNLHFFANDKKDCKFCNENNRGSITLQIKRSN